MENLGRITTGLMIIMVVAGVVIGVRSVPDVRRYLRIRAM